MSRSITIGTRGSTLAIMQTNLVVTALRAIEPSLDIHIKKILTKGDTNQSPIPLDTIGKAWFTAEIEESLLKSEIDLAIHSLKDLPPDNPIELAVLPVMERADPSDVLVSKKNISFKTLTRGAIIGTDSSRRAAQLIESRPDILVKSIRGNIDTRLRKLREEEYDGIVIAAAGLLRLGLQSEITETFDPCTFIPAPGQGILAAEIRTNNNEMRRLLERIVHTPTDLAASAERAFSRAVGGGCKLPVGCFAKIRDNNIELFGMAEHNGTIVRDSITGESSKAVSLAQKLAQKLGF